MKAPLRLDGDTRRAGKREADARGWGLDPAPRPSARARRTDARTKPVASAWMVVALWVVVGAGLWVMRQPWFLAWRDGP